MKVEAPGTGGAVAGSSEFPVAVLVAAVLAAERVSGVLVAAPLCGCVASR